MSWQRSSKCCLLASITGRSKGRPFKDRLTLVALTGKPNIHVTYLFGPLLHHPVTANPPRVGAFCFRYAGFGNQRLLIKGMREIHGNTPHSQRSSQDLAYVLTTGATNPQAMGRTTRMTGYAAKGTLRHEKDKPARMALAQLLAG